MYKPTAILFLLLGMMAQSASAEDHVCFETTQGDICMRMLPEAAPNTVANFLRYVDRGAYNGTLVHRSVRLGLSVIQGGGFSGLPANFTDPIATDAPIQLEAVRSNLRGTVAMARTSAANSATNQWFINVGDNTSLDSGIDSNGYAVFAEVTQGMHVVDQINALRIGNFSQAFGSAFGEMPITLPLNQTVAGLEHFVVVNSARKLQIQPYQCSDTSPANTLTEYCGSSVRMPVSVNGVLYEGTLEYLPERTDRLVFAVNMNRLRVLADTGQQRATFTNNELVIPSVRIGTAIYDNVRLVLSSGAPIEFTVIGFTPR